MSDLLDDAGNIVGLALEISESYSELGSYGVDGDIRDYYKIKPTRDGVLTVDLTNISNDLRLSHINSSGSVILDISDGIGSVDEQIEFEVERGDVYYLLVDSILSVANDYRLSVSLDSIGDSFEDAKVIDSSYSGSEEAGYGGDNDFYQISAETSGLMNVSLSGVESDLDLYLYNSSGVLQRLSELGGVSDELIQLNVQKDEVYYVQILSPGNNASVYDLDISIAVIDAGIQDAGNTFSTSFGISENSEFEGSVGFDGDIGDIYRVTPSFTGDFDIELGDIDANLNLYVYDSTGNEIISSTRPSNIIETAALQVVGGEALYIEVVGSGSASSNYTLSTSLSKLSSWDEDANGDIGDNAGSALQVGTYFQDDASISQFDSADVFSFTPEFDGEFFLDLTGLTGDLDVALADVANVIVTSELAGTTDETISANVQAGTTYFVSVVPFENSTSDYNLSMFVQDNKDLVTKMALLYEAALDRTPDQAGLNYFVGNIREGQTLTQIARSFYDSDEFRDGFPENEDGTPKFDNETYINQLYLNVLNREADQDGYDYWLDRLADGMLQEEILVSFAESQENRTNAADWTVGLEYNPGFDIWVL